MERFVEVPGGRLFAASDGAGSPIVLMHAAIVDHRAWDAMVPGLVDAGFGVVRYDYRAFGASTTDDLEFSNRADLLAVLDAFGIARAALVGNSRGGQIAFDTAIESPERVIAVVGVGAGLGGFDGALTPEERASSTKGSASNRPPSLTWRRSSTSTCGSGSTVRASRPTGLTGRSETPSGRWIGRSTSQGESGGGRFAWIRLRTTGWASCAARSWRSLERSTYRMSCKRRDGSRQPLRTREL